MEKHPTFMDWKTYCEDSTCACVQLCLTPWTVACQAPRSMVFSRQEYWSGLPFPSPGNLPNPGIKAVTPASSAWALYSYEKQDNAPPHKDVHILTSKTCAYVKLHGKKEIRLKVELSC